jgi:hypothetical protein
MSLSTVFWFEVRPITNPTIKRLNCTSFVESGITLFPL